MVAAAIQACHGVVHFRCELTVGGFWAQISLVWCYMRGEQPGWRRTCYILLLYLVFCRRVGLYCVEMAFFYLCGLLRVQARHDLLDVFITGVLSQIFILGSFIFIEVISFEYLACICI